MTIRLLNQAALLLAACLPTLAFAQEPVTLRTGAFAPPVSVYTQFWNAFKTNVERDSKGTIKVDLNTNDPNEANLLSNVRRGRIECVGASLQGAATILPEVAVLQLPYLFASFRQVDHAYDNDLLATYRRLFAAKGVEMMRFVEVGFTHMYGTSPIKSPGDLKGVKMRATQARASQAWVRASGGEAVVMPIGDALPGLQTGLIRGGESGVLVYGAIFAKAASHYTLTGHAFDSGAILCNKEWFDKLKPEQQQAVRNGWDSKAQSAAIRASNEQFLAEASSKGVTVHRLSAAELAAWQAAGKRATEELVANLSPEGRKIHEDILADLARLR
jgi:TRAP-type transport system periplasmic protein